MINILAYVLVSICDHNKIQDFRLTRIFYYDRKCVVLIKNKISVFKSVKAI